jgi:hypothetical protein
VWPFDDPVPPGVQDLDITISMTHWYDCFAVSVSRSRFVAFASQWCSGARDLDFSSQVCHMLRLISRAAAGELPPTDDVGGVTRKPMRRPGPYLTALNVANAWSFNRLSKRPVMCATIQGSVSQTRPGLGLRQTA